ncbi:hypothetical protein [Chromohalobacter israelensis]|uniref:Uncharacterized protein n=1 Tax=Chromohalobacter israelensis (strain ATCC BAA-138 / DSM 3043 / CIP 106854 / NCIMB 13768 / 1H11) TaxID=290398 RepID=Q1QWP7_CHRI1|nr:hypothetical protein [Chromohalobacter salexigens]ABE59111.1 hypothetical protein Csal_1759 [Chromohalobacter salexigens DSM 3043]
MASLSLFLSILISAVALTAAATMLVYRWLNRRGASSGKRGGQAARKRSASDKRRSRGGSRSPKTTTKSASKQGATGPRVAFPRLPAWLRAALPLGMMLTLIAGSGQLALQGIDNAHRASAGDPRLPALENAVDGLSLLALAFLLAGIAAWLARRQ